MPSNFFWFTENSLAGMERPGTWNSLDEDLAFLKEKKIDIIISLTVDPLRDAALERYEFEIFHIPLPDGSAPTIPQINQFVNYVTYGLRNRRKVVVHCGAGYGRTGTLFACYLVSRGATAGEAIREMRVKLPRAIENKAQEERIADYERYLREQKR